MFSCSAAWLRMHPAQWEGQHIDTDAASEMEASERILMLYIVSMPIILHVKQSTAAAS